MPLASAMPMLSSVAVGGTTNCCRAPPVPTRPSPMKKSCPSGGANDALLSAADVYVSVVGAAAGSGENTPTSAHATGRLIPEMAPTPLTLALA